MPRPKGSKNKAKVLDGVDYVAQIAEKNTAAESLAEEIAALGTNIAALNAERKAKEAELNRKKAEDIVANALASGMTAEEITELLK